MFGDAEEEEDLKPQDKSERKLVEDAGGEELGDKNAKTKKLDNAADNLLPQDEDVNVNVTEDKESINQKQEKSGQGEE